MQVLSYEFCEISENTFFTEHLLATASGAQCVSGVESLDFIISGRINKCKCINGSMLLLSLKPVTLLKTSNV